MIVSALVLRGDALPQHCTSPTHLVMGWIVWMMGLFAPPADACDYTPRPFALVNPEPARNDDILLVGDGFTGVVQARTAGGKDVPVQAQALYNANDGGVATLMFVHPRSNTWPVGESITVSIGQTFTQESLDKHAWWAPADYVSKDCDAEACTFWTESWTFQARDAVDTEAPVLSAVGPLDWPYKGRTADVEASKIDSHCGGGLVLRAPRGTAQDRGAGSSIVLFALYLVPAGTEIPQDLAPLSPQVKPSNEVPDSVDWTQPQLIVGDIPPHPVETFELGERLVFEKGHVTLPLDRELCLVARPFDLAWNTGAPVISNCVRLER